MDTLARTRTLLGLAFFWSVLLTCASEARAGEDDVVLLKDGSRLRGHVIEEDPARGVRIVLADGRTRQLGPAEVKEVRYGAASAPAEPPTTPPPASSPPSAAEPTGKLAVSVDEPAELFVNGVLVGRAPTELGLVAGTYDVRVQFDAGGDADQSVVVRDRATTEVRLGVPDSEARLRLRRGAKLGIGVEPTFQVVSWVKEAALLGGEARGFASFAPARWSELRAGGLVSVAAATGDGIGTRSFSIGQQGEDGTKLLVPVGAFGAARFLLGSVYVLSVGMAGGYAFADRGYGFVGPEWSVASFRLGEDRDFEVELRQAALFGIGGPDWIYQSGITVRHLFLGARERNASGSGAPARAAR